MRSRYSAYAVGDTDYLLKTWHPDTRPSVLTLEPELRWCRLDILATAQGGLLVSEGAVEFRAFYKTPEGADDQHEVSHFVRHAGA